MRLKFSAFRYQQLWKLVVEEADLVGQLRVMKDFFLLGRGELFLAFIDQAQGLLKLPPSASTQHGMLSSFFDHSLELINWASVLKVQWEVAFSPPPFTFSVF